jgi:hypothetical protein
MLIFTTSSEISPSLKESAAFFDIFTVLSHKTLKEYQRAAEARLTGRNAETGLTQQAGCNSRPSSERLDTTHLRGVG